MKYRIDHYKDGLYNSHYVIKRWRWWFPFWVKLHQLVAYDCCQVLEFDTVEEAEWWISETHLYDLLRERRLLRTKVKEA